MSAKKKKSLILLIDSFIRFHSSFFTFWRMSIMMSEVSEVVSSLSKNYKNIALLMKQKMT